MSLWINCFREKEKELKSEKQIKQTLIDFTSLVFRVPEPQCYRCTNNRSNFEIVQLFSL